MCKSSLTIDQILIIRSIHQRSPVFSP